MSLSVAAIQPPSAIYREEQWFGWWAYALLGLIAGLAGLMLFDRIPAALPAPVRHVRDLAFVAAMSAPAFLAIGLLRMTTVVTPTEVRVWFGWIPTYRKSQPIATIARVEVVQYRPMADFGGWGVRWGRDGERALNARGDRGVRLHLVDGSRLLIGSQRPVELALALEGALRPGI